MSTPYIATHAVEDAHESDIYTLAVCENYTISGSGDGKIALWDNKAASDGMVILNPKNTNVAGVHHLGTDGSGKYLCAVFFDGTVQIYDLQSLTPIDLPVLKKIKGAWTCAIAAQKPLLVLSTVAGKMYLIDIESKEQVMTFDPPQAAAAVATSVDITVDGRYVACALESGKVHVYSGETGRLSYTLPLLTVSPRCVRFSPNSSLIAVSGDRDSIFLFSLNGGDLVSTFSGHTSWVFNLAWSESGEYLLSVSQDRLAKVWSVETSEAVATLNDSTQPLFACAWLNKGWAPALIGGLHKGIVTAGLDRTIRWYREAAGSK